MVYYKPVNVIINIWGFIEIIINIVIKYYGFFNLIIANQSLLFTFKF